MTKKEKLREYSKNYSRTKKGWLIKIYKDQKQSSKERGHEMPTYTKKELSNWLFENCSSLFDSLWIAYVESGFKTRLVPSIDRIDSKKPYTFSNLQLMTWEENKNKGTLENRGPNHYKSKVKEYYSTKAIQRSHFKVSCNRQGWIFGEFEEVYSGEKCVRNKKYYYIELF